MKPSPPAAGANSPADLVTWTSGPVHRARNALAIVAKVERLMPDQTERFVFLTGGATHRIAAEFLASVPNTVVHKPFDIGSLREIIKVRLRR